MHYEDSLEPAEVERPAQVPEKFWDAASGQIRTDALLRAYLDLERRMHTMVKVPGPDASGDDVCGFRRAMGIPDQPEQYHIETSHEMLSSDPGVNSRLHAAGFSNPQAQLVYDLAHECMLPAMDRMAAEYDQRRHLDRLKDHYGGDARWSETARQVSAWGKANLPRDVYASLSRSADGVIAMERMMASGEPTMGRAQTPREEAPDEVELKRMM
ncbi:MAG TPA: hypothetical protein VL974_09735, partial [Magnetospirillum sp.]|nr:hypothetical protein [Magnetospirillum sp.]